jgi:phosphate transport system substrate-binding protein
MARLAAIALLSLVVGCARDAAPGVKPLSYDGATSISRHVLSEAVPAFQKRTGLAFGAVLQSGGGKGLERLFAGEVEIAGVARRLSPDELARKPFFQIIGYDALGVFVHAGNPVKGLSKAQLKAIFTGAIVNWKDAGGPNLPIVTCTEPIGSGRNTLEVFQSVALDEAPFGRAHEAPDPADCLAFVASRPGAVTFATVAFAIHGVRAVPIDGITPTPDHVLAASYLLSRPLLLVTRAPPSGDAAAFIDFMRSPEGQEIVGKRFIPIRQPSARSP